MDSGVLYLHVLVRQCRQWLMCSMLEPTSTRQFFVYILQESRMAAMHQKTTVCVKEEEKDEEPNEPGYMGCSMVDVQQRIAVCIKEEEVYGEPIEPGSMEMIAEIASGSKRKEIMTRKQEVKQKLLSGEYRTMEPDPNLKSLIWSVFKPIVDGDGNSVNYVCCVECNELYVAKGSSGTSHISRHSCVSNKQVTCVDEKRIPKFAQDKITEKCVSMCTQDLQSFEAVAGEGFLDLAQTLVNTGATYGKVSVKSIMPHPATVSQLIQEKAKSLRNEIMPEVIYYVNRGECSVAADVWTCSARRNHYLTCKVSYFVNWNLTSCILFTARFPDEPKTGEIIRKELLRRFLSLGIHETNLKKVTFTTDQGANIIAALHGYSRLNCSCHMLNTVLKNAFNVEYMSSSCPQLHFVLSAVKELVSYAKQTGFLHSLETTLEQLTDTRWNTHLTMLETVKRQYSTLCEKLSERGEIDKIEGIDIKLIDELISLLTPFKEASKELEVEDSPTLHLLLPWKMTLLKHLTKEDKETSEISLLRIRLKRYVEENLVLQRHHEIATFLWAPFRHLKMMSECQRLEVMAEVKILMAKEASGETKETLYQTESHEPPTKLQKFALWADIEDKPTPTDELERYLNQNCELVEDVASYWNEKGHMFPTLQKIAKKILCVQSLSSISERNFSSAGSILGTQRLLLNPDSVDALLFLHGISINRENE